MNRLDTTNAYNLTDQLVSAGQTTADVSDDPLLRAAAAIDGHVAALVEAGEPVRAEACTTCRHALLLAARALAAAADTIVVDELRGLIQLTLEPELHGIDGKARDLLEQLIKQTRERIVALGGAP